MFSNSENNAHCGARFSLTISLALRCRTALDRPLARCQPYPTQCSFDVVHSGDSWSCSLGLLPGVSSLLDGFKRLGSDVG